MKKWWRDAETFPKTLYGRVRPHGVSCSWHCMDLFCPKVHTPPCTTYTHKCLNDLYIPFLSSTRPLRSSWFPPTHPTRTAPTPPGITPHHTAQVWTRTSVRVPGSRTSPSRPTTAWTATRIPCLYVMQATNGIPTIPPTWIEPSAMWTGHTSQCFIGNSIGSEL